MKLFDGYVAVDWSANGKPKQGKDSIWIAIRGVNGTEEPENPATRREAVGRIERLLEKATAAGRRLLLPRPLSRPALRPVRGALRGHVSAR